MNNDINVEDILRINKNKFSHQICERGEDYYDNGNVVECYKSGLWFVY